MNLVQLVLGLLSDLVLYFLQLCRCSRRHILQKQIVEGLYEDINFTELEQWGKN